MPRPRTGTIFRHGDHYDIQVTLTDGKRSKRMCQPPEMSEARARDKALRLTQRAQKDGAVAAPKRKANDRPVPGETFEAWAQRWYAV